MNYHDFCVLFYNKDKKTSGLRIHRSQPQIAEFFLKAALSNFADNYLTYSEDTFRKWFLGERIISGDLWKIITDNYNEATFMNFLDDELNRNQLAQILLGMGYGTYNNDFESAKQFIAKTFYGIAFGNGEISNLSDALNTEQKNADITKSKQNIQEILSAFNHDYFQMIVTLGDIHNQEFVSTSFSRFLTDNSPKEIIERCKELTKTGREELQTFPVIICNENTKYSGETDPNQLAIFAKATRIKKAGANVMMRFQKLAVFPQIKLCKNPYDFGLDMTSTLTSLNSSHWFVRDIDIFEAFEDSGIALSFLSKETI